jgi:hypothetical protein
MPLISLNLQKMEIVGSVIFSALYETVMVSGDRK